VSLTITVQAMVEAGCTAEQIAAVVGAYEGEAEKKRAAKRANNAERQRRFRVTHRNADNALHDVSARYTPSPDKEKSPTPPKEINPTPASLRSAPPTPPATPREFLLECLSAESADAVLAHRRAKRSPLTARAAQLLAKGFMSTGDPNAAADMMIERGWQGFKPEWFDNERAGNGGKSSGKGNLVDAGRALIERLDNQFGHLDGPEDRGALRDPALRLLPGQRGQ
jgi:hypothetical protein